MYVAVRYRFIHSNYTDKSKLVILMHTSNPMIMHTIYQSTATILLEVLFKCNYTAFIFILTFKGCNIIFPIANLFIINNVVRRFVLDV